MIFRGPSPGLGRTTSSWSACAPKSARARGHGVSQGTDRPARDGLGPKCKRWHPERVAAVPFLRNGEGKKSPLRRLPTDHRESLTQTGLRLASRRGTVVVVVVEGGISESELPKRKPGERGNGRSHRRVKLWGGSSSYFLPPAIPPNNRCYQSFEQSEHPTTISPTRVRLTSIVLTSIL